MVRSTALSAAIFKIFILGGTATVVAAECGEKAKKSAFSRCVACHNYDNPKKKFGPSLQGIMGRKAGMLADFKFSKDMALAGEKGLVWNKTSLASYLKPKKKGGGRAYVGSFIGKKSAKTKMVFTGFSREKKVNAVVCFLEQRAK